MRVVMLSVAVVAALLSGCASTPAPTSQLQIKDDAVRPKARTMYAAPAVDAAPVAPPAIWRVAELPRS